MNIEDIALKFMTALLANPVIDEIELEDGENGFEHLAKISIEAAQAFEKEISSYVTTPIEIVINE